jgi:hypothetical protein
MDKEKAIISDGLSSLAPQAGLFSNQFWDELRAYATLNYLFNSVLCKNNLIQKKQD